MRIGSLFSGIGGLDLAVEAATGGQTVWQVESNEHCRQVLARHWPPVERFDDVATATGLPAVDVLCGGFPCGDTSTAGPKTGLAGSRSSLFYQMTRLARELQPSLMVIENVAELLRYRAAVDAELLASGYLPAWVRCYASSAGAPHSRRRVFVVCTKTSSAGFALVPSLIDLKPEVKPTWSSPNASDHKYHGCSTTPSVMRRLAAGKQTALSMQVPGKLNPAWVAALMGLPGGWSDTSGSSLRAAALDLLSRPRWPANRHTSHQTWEPSRIITDRMMGRPERLRCLGNAVVPQQALLALSHLLPTTEAAT